MDRRRIARWTLFAALSAAFHLGVGVSWVLAQPSSSYLPRVFLYEVVGVEVADERPAPADRDGPGAAASKVAAAPAAAATQAKVAQAKRAGRKGSGPAESVEAVPATRPAEPRETEAPTQAPQEPQDPRPAGPEGSESGQEGAAGDEEGTEAAQDGSEAPPEISPDDLLALPETISSSEPGATGSPLSPILVDKARVVVFVRTQRLAQSPNAGALRRVMRAVPGYQLYLGESAFDPLSDFEWMTARNPNLSSTTTTVLVARLAIDGERARAAVEQIPTPGGTVEWSERGDALVGVHGGEAPSRAWQRVGWALAGEPRTIFMAGPRRWVERAAPGATKLASESPVAELQEVRVGGEPADLAVATGRLGALFGTPEHPGPSVEGVLLAMRFGDGDDDALAAARLWFKTDRDARRFALQARQELAQMGDHPLARLLDVSSMAGRLELHQEGAEVTAWLPLEPAQAQRLLGLVTVLLQRGNASGAPRPGPAAPRPLQSN
jgi:hypothetical protein